MTHRLKKLEKKFFREQEHWAVFTMDCYNNPEHRKQAQQRLIDEYIARGAPRPTYRIFVNEIPYSTSE